MRYTPAEIKYLEENWPIKTHQEMALYLGGKFFEVQASKKRKYCSSLCAMRRERGNFNFTRGKGGRRQDLGNIYFRSSYEANYARFLNLLVRLKEIKGWKFEPDTFWFEKIKRGVRSYTPDFKIFNNDNSIEYHEVKGWDYPRGKTARKRMAKYYPKVALKLVDEEFFKEIHRKHLDKMIPNWEFRDRNKG